MAGTIAYSLSQQLDKFGDPLAGGKLDIFQAGTVATRQNAYSDSGLTLVLPNPIVLDEAGRLPQFFLADGLIKVRLSDKDGTTQVTADNIQVVGPSGGGGGGATVDPTSVLATGDIKVRYGTGILSGFVRANSRTIGSAISGATERANADCQALFEFLWAVDGNLAVSGGRGGSANADWVASKTLALPDWRGRLIGALDDMGTTSALRLAGVLASTTLGAAGGSQVQVITQANLPNITFNITASSVSSSNTSVTDSGHRHLAIANDLGYGTIVAGTSSALVGAGAFSSVFGNTTLNGVYQTGAGVANLTATTTTSTTTSGTAASGGSNTALVTTPPVLLVTVYLKL